MTASTRTRRPVGGGSRSTATRGTTAPTRPDPRRRPTSGQARRDVGIDPRIHQRRADVLRQEARRRLRITVSVLAVLVLVAGGWLLLHTRLLAARVVTVVGAAHTPKAEILRAGGLTSHPPLIDVNASVASRIEQLPWIARATVTRQWPDGVRVAVVERTPVAAVAVDPATPSAGWAEVDRGGRVLTTVATVPSGLVKVSGAGAPGAPGTTLGSAVAALRVASSLPPAFAAQVTDVQQRGGTVTLHLTSPLTVYLGSTADLPEKYEDVAALLAGAHLTAGQVIDVAVPATPVVRG
jgi:hypothetical protein